MATPAPDQLLLIGTIVAPFGVRGQLKLRAVTDRPDHLRRHIHTVYVGPRYQPYRLRSVAEHKPGLLIVSLDGVTSRDEAEDLRQSEVWIDQAVAAPLQEDEYYLHDLYNLRVETIDGTVIGHVREVLETGANEVLVVSRSGQSDALIPMVREFVETLDIPAGRVVVRIIEGLL